MAVSREQDRLVRSAIARFDQVQRVTDLERDWREHFSRRQSEGRDRG
jgi:hypothetical protein